MVSPIDERLTALGISLPEAAAPAANYVPFAIDGNLIFTSGQLPLKQGALIAEGLVGKDLDVEAGKEAAKW